MRTEIINLYNINELGEKAQEKAIDDARFIVSFPWMDEYNDSLKAFCDALGIPVPSWESDAWMNFRFSPNREVWQRYLGGRFVEEFDKDAMPTGFYADEDLFNTFVTCWEDHSDPVHAVEVSFRKFFKALEEDYQYYYSDEGIKEFLEANGYEFLENGKIWR